MTRAVRSWEEQDAYTGWRRYLRWRPGELARVKRRTHKRERRDARTVIAAQLDEYDDAADPAMRACCGTLPGTGHLGTCDKSLMRSGRFQP